MSRSKEITLYKQKIMSSIINSESIVDALAEPNIAIENADELINLCIFDYNKIPNTEQTARNFITIQVNIPRIEKGSVWREVVTVIRVITHISKMDLTGKGNRMDYISSELDELLSEREDFGYGQMLITSNVEGAISDNWLARTMTFTSTNSNVSFCG